MADFLFRPNASTVEKALTLVAICTCLLAIYGMVMAFTPSAKVKQAALYVAAFVGAVFTVAVLRDRHPNNRVPTFGPIKKLCFAMGFFLVASGMTWAATALGAASLANSVIGEVSASPASVDFIANRNYGKGCSFSFTVRYASFNEGATTLCASENFWASLRLDQEITVVQRRSALGTDVLGFRSGS